MPFPAALKDKAPVVAKIRDAVKSSELANDMVFLDLDNASELNRLSLEEEHLISPQMLDGKNKGVILNKDNTVSIMLMEEDHIRLQVIYGGLKLDEAYSEASRIDDIIENGVNYAFDEEFGYLTAWSDKCRNRYESIGNDAPPGIGLYQKYRSDHSIRNRLGH